ncbi:MAG TPA: hypothetical protein VG795_09355 [Acidimicrobiia bacterium]|nr:hypothetical protein [Acidimicrobiia bacterium]
MIEGRDVGVRAIPFEELRYWSAPQAGTLTFDCGSARYFLSDNGPPGPLEFPAPDRRFLERAARRLIPRLYCAPGRMEYVAR